MTQDEKINLLNNSEQLLDKLVTSGVNNALIVVNLFNGIRALKDDIAKENAQEE